MVSNKFGKGFQISLNEVSQMFKKKLYGFKDNNSETLLCFKQVCAKVSKKPKWNHNLKDVVLDILT